ncbi:ceramide-1-phosphate transfer protein [Chrysoperla carnea]|uniref:ceramide-1-phosphate transfer protein n=1 Tax=Chrysoperla carnea TaxID=189513 RepID=UPI001D0682FA|nr:ceramide-1-phosphate transfer protein [Chrysoperla carnea]
MEKNSLDATENIEKDSEIKVRAFNLEKVHDLFTDSLKESEDIYLSAYLEAYKELNKFFVLMGSMFSFVSSEIDTKVAILEKLIEASHLETSTNGAREQVENNMNGSVVHDPSNPFESINSMIDYERSNDLLTKKDYVSGSRTLLRLHRGLDFIRVFLRDLSQLQSTVCVAQCCKQAYDRTLSKYHSWFIRKAVNLATYTMPTQRQLLNKVCGSDVEIQNTLQLLPTMLEVTDEVYNRTQSIFEISNLLNLG